ncbi:MAG TPA: histidine phosphatase family protein [Candidatus Binatia bacterium]
MTPTPACRRLYLVRHGETLYGGERHLTELGYKQIEALGALLAGVPLEAIYSSPLDRAQATAQTIARFVPAPIVTVDALREIEPGAIEGDDFAQILGDIRGYFAGPETTWDTPFLGGETYRQVRDRVWPLIEDHAQRSDWSRVALVAHGGVNNAVLGRILGTTGPGLANIDQDFGCLNIIDFFGERPVIRLLNFTAYDAMKLALEAPSIDAVADLLRTSLYPVGPRLRS